MALIKCTECGKEISTKATACPNCGAPVNSADVTPETTMSPIPEEPKKGKKEKKKGSCFGTALKMFGVLIILIIVISVFSGGNDNDSKETVATKTGEVESHDNSERIQDNDVPAEVTEEPIDAPEEVENVFQIGDIVEAKDCKISFLSAGEYDTGNEFLQPKDGYAYYQMEFEFENIGDSDLALSSMLGWNCYADDYKVDQTWIGNENGLDGSVSPGKKAKGSVYFEVPKDAESIELEYETNFWTEDKIIFVVK